MLKRLIPALLVVAYGAVLLKLMVFKDVPLIKIGGIMLNFGGTDAGHAPNFIPFVTIVPYLLGHKGLVIAGINLVGNIALLVPLGFLVPFLYRSITWKKALVIAAATSLVIEVLQVVLRVGIFDIDDVILNALGFMLGYGVFVVLAKMARAMRPNTLALAIVVFAVVTVAAAFYVQQKLQISFEPAVVAELGWMPQGRDLCGGTGGNGQIVSVASNSFVMEQSRGGTQTVTLANGAEVNTPTGPGSIADLKAGNRVTLVGGPNPDGSFTADAVFVCN